MKAAICYKYGAPSDVIKITEVEKPNPKEGEVLIKIQTASVNAADWRGVRGTPFFTRAITGLLKPRNKIPGDDFSGLVEAAGPGTKQFKPGDEVMGCLIDVGAGCFAEYVCAKESLLAPKLPCVSFEDAAALPMAAVSYVETGHPKGKVVIRIVDEVNLK
jgi:NADPH:quinone reductase and related Zn-dependent oxidoreductases